MLSPSHSQGASRRSRTRRTLSVASPARSDASGKLSSVVEKFIKSDKFTMSPMRRRSVLPDDTEIEAPRRASWWKRIEGSSRDVLEALDTNKMPADLLVEEYEFEVEKDKEKTVSECSDNESVASIVVPQRRLFNQKKETQGKFRDIIGSRKSLGRTNIEDISIDKVPKNLFNKGPRNRPVFPATLLNSTNKTINKTVEPEPSKPNRPNLFGQAGTKRKNIFTDFVLSESEEDSEVQPKVFGFKKYDNKRMSLGTRNRRMPSLTPSITTEIDIDDWNLLPSSTMIGGQEGSRMITDEDIDQIPNENQDDTLTEDNVLKAINISKRRSIRESDENDRTLTNDNIDNASKCQAENNIPNKINRTHGHSKTKLHDSVKENITEPVSPKPTKTDGEKNIENAHQEHELNTSHRPTEYGTLIEDKMAELHGESIVKDKSHRKTLIQSHRKSQNSSKNVSTSKQDKNLLVQSDKDKSQQVIEPKADEQESQNRSKESKIENNMEDTTPSAEEQESSLKSKEASISNEDEEIQDVSETDKSEDDIELSAEDSESYEASDTNQGEDIEETSGKENNNEEIEKSSHDHETQNSSKEISNEKQDEEMEKMVWNDNEDDKQSEHDETHENAQAELREVEEPNCNDEREHVSVNKIVTNKSQTVIEYSVDHDPMEQDVVDETPNNSTHDTTGRNRKKEETHVKSPEAVRQNVTKDNESFRPIGRSTSFRKSKSVIENIIIRPSLAPVQESTLGSDGSKNSSTEGSGWDSHRTTRKTIRLTLGKDFTPRKSLRALVMEQSAQRQTEIYNKNASKLKMTKNKTVLEDGDGQNKSKANQTKNMDNDSVPEISIKRRDIEVESEQDIEAESEQESQQEIEAESEKESQLEIETESEQEDLDREDHDMSNEIAQSDQKIVHDVSEEPDIEHSVQDDNNDEDSDHLISGLNSQYHMSISNRTEHVVFDNEISEEAESEQESQQEIEAESEKESQLEIEAESEQEDSDREDHDMSNEIAQSDQEIVHDVSEEPDIEHSVQDDNNDEDSDHLISGLNSQYHMSNSNRTERVVFDNEISEQEIGYELSERVSRQLTDNEICEHVSEREATPEVTRSRVSDHSKVHDVSIGTKRSMLLMQIQKKVQQNMEIKQKIREKVQNSLKPSRNFNMMSPIRSKCPIRRINKTDSKKPKTKPKPKNIPMEALPKAFVEDLKYKPPKRYQPASAPWITKRLYKFLENKLEPKYDYRARVRAEELVQAIHSFTKLVRRRDLAPQSAVDELKREMARLHIVNTHFEFYEFFHEFMPREIRIKVNPDVVNKIPMPRNGVFADIIPARAAVE